MLLWAIRMGTQYHRGLIEVNFITFFFLRPVKFCQKLIIVIKSVLQPEISGQLSEKMSKIA